MNSNCYLGAEEENLSIMIDGLFVICYNNIYIADVAWNGFHGRWAVLSGFGVTLYDRGLYRFRRAH